MEQLKSFIYYSGLLLWIIVILFVILRLIYGSNWAKRLGFSILLGRDIKFSMRELVSELKQNKLKSETISDVSVAIFYRLTRIGFLGFLIALIPIVLLYNQNLLIQSQNKLFQYQNDRVTEQTDLFKKQNTKIDLQNSYLEEQTGLYSSQLDQIDKQNFLVEDQNKLVKAQTKKLQEQQLTLSESNRKSSLVFLMSNILDKLDEELKNNNSREVSKELVARIIALSNSFKPYYFYENNKLRTQPLSPERGQLFVALVRSGIDIEFLSNEIFPESNFAFSDLRDVSLRDLNISYVNLSNSDFLGADLSNTTFEGTSLSSCNFKNTILKKAKILVTDVKGAIFEDADLRGTNFYYVSGLNKKKIFKNNITDKTTTIE